MNEEQFDNDVLEIELPAYQEDSFAIPDVPTESSFAENKEEIYRRNRLMAADMQMDVLAAEEETRAAKKAEFEDLYKESAAVVNYNRSMKIIFSVLAVMLAAVIAVLAILFIQMRDSFKNVSVSADAEEVVSVMTVSESKEVTAPAIDEEAEEAAETVDPALKTTVVRDPFENDGSALIYNTDVMSYKFEPYYTLDENGKLRLAMDVEVLNLTDYEYFIVPTFEMRTDTVPENVLRTMTDSASIGERSSKFLAFWADDDIMLVFEFDNRDHLCSFRLDFVVSEDEPFKSFSYAPTYIINSEYIDKVDAGFEIPFEELEKYIKD